MYRCRSCDTILHAPRCVCGTSHTVLGDGRMDAPGGDPRLNPPEQMTLAEALERSLEPRTGDPGFRHLSLVKEPPL
jgi:hypothetical protein